MKNSLKLFLIFFSLFITNQSFSSEAQDSSKSKKSNQKLSAIPIEKVKDEKLTPPKVKKGEFTVFFKDHYETHKIKDYKGLSLDESCFKKLSEKGEPQCMAYEMALVKPKKVELPHPAMNNKAAFYCQALNGQNLITIDHNRNESDYCRFADGSFVGSWGMVKYQEDLASEKKDGKAGAGN